MEITQKSVQQQIFITTTLMKIVFVNSVENQQNGSINVISDTAPKNVSANTFTHELNLVPTLPKKP